MAVPKKQRTRIVLKGLESAIEWQCAHNAVTHAEMNKRITLEYETPDGLLTLHVQPIGQEKLVISRAKDSSKNKQGR